MREQGSYVFVRRTQHVPLTSNSELLLRQTVDWLAPNLKSALSQGLWVEGLVALLGCGNFPVPSQSAFGVFSGHEFLPTRISAILGFFGSSWTNNAHYQSQ
jgi:hypothetical protein